MTMVKNNIFEGGSMDDLNQNPVGGQPADAGSTTPAGDDTSAMPQGGEMPVEKPAEAPMEETPAPEAPEAPAEGGSVDAGEASEQGPAAPAA